LLAVSLQFFSEISTRIGNEAVTYLVYPPTIVFVLLDSVEIVTVVAPRTQF
jgi:hypothetical protein